MSWLETTDVVSERFLPLSKLQKRSRFSLNRNDYVGICSTSEYNITS